MFPIKSRSEAINLTIALEAVFIRDPSGCIGSQDIYHPARWRPYLEVFEHINVVARVKDVADPIPKELALNDKNIGFMPLPFYKGGKHLLSVFFPLVWKIWQYSKSNENYLLRLPGPIGSLLGLCLILRGKPYAIQMVGDIDAVIATGNFRRLVKLSRLPLKWLTKILCRIASTTSYVTSRTLQDKYPPGDSDNNFPYSDVVIDTSAFNVGFTAKKTMDVVQIGFCGSLAQMYKGLDILILAVEILQKRNIEVSVKVMGDGHYRTELVAMANAHGVANQFHFLGKLEHDAVMSTLRLVDLFVMPSRTEGLPRALIEAMSVSRPCIASRVGGIPELLTDNGLVETENPLALAERIERFINDPELMQSEATRNRDFAIKHFNPEIRSQMRDKFLNEIKRKGLNVTT